MFYPSSLLTKKLLTKKGENMKIDDIKEREEYTLWRRRNRVRLVDIAEYCDCTIPLISMWENGKRNIPDKILAKYDEYISEFEKGKIYAKNQ